MALALYRKYRPATFADVVGQDHVTQPLRTALAAGRINHAYLFSGPRGCGKTSSARIMARSLNCVEGPTPDPCGVCPSCIALAPEGPGSLDVVELDAASHGGVDDTRELRDRAFYMPAESRYRVFIIDEAHMVSAAGFNALLKIVEEPPEHLVFIFATTEPEKVMTTIRSRTHHYPFRLIPPATLRKLLEKLCAEENVTVDAAVYPLVIRAGGGSARDSLSILDQLLAGAGPEGVTYRHAVALLGVTDAALLDETVDAFAAADGASVFGAIDKVVEAGHDPRRFAADLLQRFRDLVVLAAVPDAGVKGLIDAPEDQLAAMQGQSERLGAGTLTRLADVLHVGLTEMRGTTAPRLALELMCARMLLPSASGGEGALVQRVERLEQVMAGGGSVAALPAAAAASRARPAGPTAVPPQLAASAGVPAASPAAVAVPPVVAAPVSASVTEPVTGVPAVNPPPPAVPESSNDGAADGSTSRNAAGYRRPSQRPASAPAGPHSPSGESGGGSQSSPRPAAAAAPAASTQVAAAINPDLGLPPPPVLSTSRRSGGGGRAPAASAPPPEPAAEALSDTAAEAPFEPAAEAPETVVVAPTEDWLPPDAPPDEEEYGDPVPASPSPAVRAASSNAANTSRPTTPVATATPVVRSTSVAGSTPIAGSTPLRRAAAVAPAPPTPSSDVRTAVPAAVATSEPAAGRSAPAAAASSTAPSRSSDAKAPAVVAEPASAGAPDEVGVTDARRVWPEILAAVQRRKRVTQAMLQSATVVDLKANVLHLTLGAPSMARRVMEPANVTVLREALKEVLGVEWAIRCDVPGDNAPAAKPNLSLVPNAPPPTDEDVPDEDDLNAADPASREYVPGDPEVTAIELLTQQLGAKRLDS